MKPDRVSLISAAFFAMCGILFIFAWFYQTEPFPKFMLGFAVGCEFTSAFIFTFRYIKERKAYLKSNPDKMNGI